VTQSGTGLEVVSWLDHDYDVNRAALRSLGFDAVDGIPDLGQIHDAIEPSTVDWLNSRNAVGLRDELIIAPSVERYGLKGTKTAPGLTRRFEGKQSWWWGYDTLSDSEMWGDFDDHDPIHGSAAPGMAFAAGILLGDLVEPNGPATQTKELLTDSGLVYAGLPLDRQRQLFAAERTAHAEAGRQLEHLTAAQFIIMAAKRRITREHWPSSLPGTATKMIQYLERPAPRPMSMPGADGTNAASYAIPILTSVDKKRLLFKAVATDAYSGGGYRRTIAIDLV
jgi:hypothetical protein